MQSKVPFAIHHSPEVLSSLNLKSAEKQLLLLEAILFNLPNEGRYISEANISV